MIQATIYYQDEMTLAGYRVSGHADYGEHGEDIVCAAVSALAITTANGLLAQGVVAQALVDEAGVLTCLIDKEQSELGSIRAQAILQTLVLGLREISLQYPEHVIMCNETYEEV